MSILVVGDVHGCYYTFKKLVDENFQPGEDLLVQVGDLIDRGNFAPETVGYARELQEEHQAVFLKGNHEALMLEHFRKREIPGWLMQGGAQTVAQYESLKRDVESDLHWFEMLPLFWENECVFISHAGISSLTDDPFKENHSENIIWTRSLLKNIGKLQIHGHTPQLDGTPKFNEASQSWNIDTAAVYGAGLTALQLDETGDVLKTIFVKTDEKDIKNNF
ncbi:MAG TPA: metallophosphoesterase family protein [Patescibacteria group bacterium]|nr:metallophosphoesterase family protein [Patescibacteria group bacterium]